MIDLKRIPSPIIRRGNATVAYRDPAVVFHEGVFRLFYSHVVREGDGRRFWYLGVMRSRDLVTWSEPELLTPRDQNLNYSSPGNVIRFNGKWVICLQTYLTPNNEEFGTEDARVWTMESDDLERWGPARLLAVKGPDVAVKDMGRMIDPYLLEDKDEPGKWWCFYKQNGMSYSSSRDLKTWTYEGRTKCGENVCVLVDREADEYVVIHSPKNGVGVLRSRDLKEWRDEGVTTLGQAQWPWARGRLTAGFVLDMRSHPEIGKYLLFFHGSAPNTMEVHGHASLGLAWGEDLRRWEWAEGGQAGRV